MFSEEEYDAYMETKQEEDYDYLSTIPIKTILEYLISQDIDNIVEELLVENPPSALSIASDITKVNSKDLSYILSFVYPDTLRELLTNLEFYQRSQYADPS